MRAHAVIVYWITAQTTLALPLQLGGGQKQFGFCIIKNVGAELSWGVFWRSVSMNWVWDAVVRSSIGALEVVWFAVKTHRSCLKTSDILRLPVRSYSRMLPKCFCIAIAVEEKFTTMHGKLKESFHNLMRRKQQRHIAKPERLISI